MPKIEDGQLDEGASKLVDILHKHRVSKSSNRAVHIRGASFMQFTAAVALAFSSVTASYYSVSSEHGLVLYWGQPSEVSPSPKELPYELDVKAAISFAWNWLRQAEWPREPDHDGSNERGFYVSTGDTWGHAGGSFYGIIQIKPDWLEYGK